APLTRGEVGLSPAQLATTADPTVAMPINNERVRIEYPSQRAATACFPYCATAAARPPCQTAIALCSNDLSRPVAMTDRGSRLEVVVFLVGRARIFAQRIQQPRCPSA